MAEGILGLGSSGSNGLSSELIDKLKKAEAKGKVDPYDKRLEDWDKELEVMDNINSKVNDLLAVMTQFDLYKSGTNAFEEITASTTGTSALFDAIDVTGLSEGTNSVTVNQLAQKDVYQSGIFNDKDAQIAGGSDVGDKISINIAGTTYDFTTENKTYDELAKDINANSNLTASVEEVGNNEFRLVIKSTKTGLENKMNILQSGVSLGYNPNIHTKQFDYVNSQIPGANDPGDKLIIDGVEFTTEGKSITALKDDINANPDFKASWSGRGLIIKRIDGDDISIEQVGVDFLQSNAILKAQNMQATVDGVDYDVASNTITVQGNLKMTAFELGTSTISIQKDSSQILPQLKDMATKYNELIDLIDNELYSADSVIEDTSSLKSIMGQIKNFFYGSYGGKDDLGNDKNLNLFNFGFSVDKAGHMQVDDKILGKALTDNLDDIKELFIGVAEKPGLGTSLKEYLDGLDGYEGILSQYGENMVKKKSDLEDDKTKAQEILDNKYSQMSLQFAAYTAIITQMEAAFGGMKMMMEQSTAR